jgi:hypothetical protein
MRHIHDLTAVATGISLALLVPPALAAPAKKAAAATTPSPSPAPSQGTIAPEISKALADMANQMKALTSFEMRADTTMEDVLENGQKLQNSALITISARRPDRFLMNIDSARRSRRLYYDGKQLTIFAPVSGYYATVPAPPTTREVIDQLAKRYDVETPLADLFEWGASGVHTEKIKSAMFAGSDKIGDQDCAHYAFRQEGTDWQIWISRGANPLPCKLVIVNTEDPAQPQSTMVFSWTPNQQFADSVFSFAPPANAMRIPISQVANAAKEPRK